MCEFCTKHGEGKRWYLNARNYGEDLAADLRRRRFMRDFNRDFPTTGRRTLQQLEQFRRLPGIVKSMVRWGATRHMKKTHYGQVLPLEEVEQVFAIVNSVARLPCVCREVTRGDAQARYCFGLSILPHFPGATIAEDYQAGPTGIGLEEVPREKALQMVRDFEQQGLMHSVWTFITPFIGGLCNCDRSDCLAMVSTVGYGMPVMLRGHARAAVDWERCRGCRACMRQCQFGAIGYSAVAGKCFVDATACYGCGICRAACPAQAISLKEWE